MSEQRIEDFKQTLRERLSFWHLNALGAYGRYLQLRAPTKLKKKDLIEAIVETICGERMESRNNRGAPVKAAYLDPKLVLEIENLIEKFSFVETFCVTSAEPNAAEPAPDQDTVQESEQDSEPNAEEEDPAVQVNISVNLEKLTKKQKKLLTDFLNSVSA